MRPITDKQRAVLNMVCTHNRNGIKPTYKQLANDLGYKSLSGIQRHIEALRFRGLVDSSNFKHGISQGEGLLAMQKSVTKDLEWLKDLRIHNQHGDEMSDAVIEQLAWYVVGISTGQYPPGTEELEQS